MQDPYSQRVRRYFVSPVHAGDLKNSYSLVLSARVSDGAGTELCLEAGIESGTLQELRFRALACPHLIAAAEYCCERFEGEVVGALSEFQPDDVIRLLDVPVGKTGRILLLEDAIQLLRQKIGEHS